MSEDFSKYNNAKFSNVVNTLTLYEHLNNFDENSGDTNFPYDHMYATNTETNKVDALEQKQNCQTAESEVKFLREWLILHLDLIQQQNDEILSKEKTILILQQENEMLKERISCMERGAPFPPSKHFLNHTPIDFNQEIVTDEDMTQGLGSCDGDNTDTLHFEVNYDNVDNCMLELAEVQHSILGDTQSQTDELEAVNYPGNNSAESDLNNVLTPDVKNQCKSESGLMNSLNSSADFNYSFNSSEFDPMKNLRMSIRRKRVCSNSSALSHNGSMGDEKKSFRRFRKRRKRSLKDTQILTTPDHYVTQVGEVKLGISITPEPPIVIPKNRVLEVPQWRVRIYSSCYSMEGTENLDDEVYNKRHSRLENDERRRKRWDVQRIREQRVIEKLKQRQERIDSGAKEDDNNDVTASFWPSMEDVKFIEVCEELPVSAFGCPIPKIIPSEFSLPWLNNPAIVKKVPAKKASVKKKSSKR